MDASQTNVPPDDEERALTDLVMNSKELIALEARLSRFNVFRVLRAAQHEIRHSNMLAWLFDPDESHGLSDLFLRRWLMQVVHDAGPADAAGPLPSPIEIDALSIDYVEVEREHEGIDLLVSLKTTRGQTWVICIENKVESTQHSNQLTKYRGYVERRFSSAARRLFIFLTKNEEDPEDPSFITSSYTTIERVLGGCIKERKSVIRPEPRLLLEQYRELLGEDFVDEGRTALLARQIYQKHRKAIDVILKYREDAISIATATMEDVLRTNFEGLAVSLGTRNKGYVRFLPPEWAIPENAGGDAWGKTGRFIVVEVYLWASKVELHIAIGRAPGDWADRIWSRAATAPFKQEYKKRPSQYFKIYRSKSDILIETLPDEEPENARARLLDWLQAELQKPKFKEAVVAVANLLKGVA